MRPISVGIERTARTRATPRRGGQRRYETLVPPSNPVVRQRCPCPLPPRQEDAELLRLAQGHVGEFTFRDWARIGNAIGKTTKQCRERWCNVLSPDLVKLREPWTEADLEILFQAQQTLGSKWSKIAEVYFKGR